MKNPARYAVIAGLILILAGLSQAPLSAQGTGPAGNVQTFWDLVDVKVGNTTTTINSTTYTGNNGAIVLPSNAIGLVPTNTSTYYCRDGKMIAIENQGQKPKDVNCGGGWIPIGDYNIGGGYSLGLDYGLNGGYTITEHHTNTGMGGGHPQTGNFPRYEVFGGFNYFAEPYSSPSLSSVTSYAGFDTSFAYNASKHVGIVGEFGGVYQLGVETPGLGGSAESTNLYSFMGGVQFNCRRGRTFNPYAQALFGDVYARNTLTVNGSGGITSTTSSSNGFGMRLGVGVDLNVSPHISVVPFQVNYFLTDFSGSVGNNFSYQGGIRFKF